MEMNQYGPVLLTGGSTGIGRATTELLAARGHLVYATARKNSDIRILDSIPNVRPIRLDVTNPVSVAKAVKIVRERRKGLYGLVNNAGGGVAWPLPALEVEDMIPDFELNVFGVHRVTRAMLPFLVKSRGRIVNISSIAGLATSKYLGAYCMTKNALETYSESLARWLEKYGVSVSVVEPGTFRSEVTQKGQARTVGLLRKRRDRIFIQDVNEVMDWYPKGVWSAAREPRPKEIPEAVADALFSKQPRFRYCPCPYKGELSWAVEGPIVRSVQANLGGGKFSLSRQELHSVLDKIWDKEAKRGHA
jgi:NAD(P)-dependent dehydrogenase (short-subunit alcohol dehydrogenase family)